MEEIINFRNNDVALEGTLYKPDAAEPYPLIVATHPSGEGLRNSEIFIHLREVFPEIGIGVFLYDRRGSGKSKGNFESSTFHDLAQDLIAAVENLNGRNDIDSEKIAIWGLSQGGWIAPLAASLCKCVSHLIAVSSSSNTPACQMTYSAGFLMRNEGFSKRDIDLMVNLHQEFLLFYRGILPRSKILKKINEYKTQPWFALSYLAEDPPCYPQETKFFKEMDYDPIPTIEILNIPVLLIFAERDPWVDIQKSIFSWRENGPNEISIRQIQNANHFMKSIYHSGLEGPEGPISEEYINILMTWVREQFFIKK